MNNSAGLNALIEEAASYYSKGDYATALKKYQDLSCLVGISSFEEILKDCHKKLNPDYCVESEYKVTVIIPTYNSEKYIERAINSVLMQTLKEVEIICFDDGSTDLTRVLLHAMRHEHKNIKIMYDRENFGQGKRRNQALAVAKGEYITFLDSDDYFDNKYYFEIFYNECVQNNYDIMVAPYMRLKNDKISKDRFPDAIYDGLTAAQKFISREFGTHGPCAKFYKRTIAENNYFVEYGYSQDVLYVWRALLMAKTVKAKYKYGYVYFHDNNSSWRPVNYTLKHFYSSLRLLAEILCIALFLDHNGRNIDLKNFYNSWKIDHAPRIKAVCNGDIDSGEIKAVIEKINFIKPFLLELFPDNLKLKRICYGNFNLKKCLLPIEAYSQQLIKQFNNYLNKTKEKGRKKLIIYTDRLAIGGLEKVACQIGNVLSKDYEIIYLLKDPKSVTYSYTGKILSNNLYDVNVLRALHEADYILDFKWKNIRREDPLCMFAVQNYSSKYITTIHNTDTCYQYFQKIKEYLGENSPEILRKIVCVSENVKHYMEMRYGKFSNMCVLHNPIEFDKIDNCAVQENSYGEYMIFSGRINATKHKGIDLLLRAYANSSLKGKCKLVFAGNGEFEKSVKNIIDYFNLDQDIICTGYRNEIYTLLKNALFLVAPSRWEGFSLTLVEALGCGIPVLSTDAGGAKEVLKHKKNGFLCKKNCVKDIIDGLEYLYNNHIKMKSCCRRSIEYLDIKNYKKRVNKILE